MSSKWITLLCILLAVLVASMCVLGYFLIVGADKTLPSSDGQTGNEQPSDTPSTETGEEEQENEKINYVHFLDVGQGDCTLIETYEGSFVIIDASIGEAEHKILSYLEDRNVKEIEYAIFTHPHEDHIGSADAVVEHFNVKNVIMNDKTTNTSCFNRLVNAISDSKKEKGTKVYMAEKGDTYSIDNLEFTILSDGKKYDDLNDSSICVRFECGDNGLLFTGDAGTQVEKDILKDGFDVSASIYKCGHHGSSTSNSNKFLDKVNPTVAVISCGWNNDYGHPHDEVELALYKRDIDYFRTDLDGDIVIGFDEEYLYIPEAA